MRDTAGLTLITATLVATALAGCDTPAPEPAAPQTPQSSVPQAQTSAQPATVTAPIDKPEPAPARPQDEFFERIAALCGQAYAGYLTVGTEPSDRDIGEADLTIRVDDCSADGVDIAFDVGEDRSRTWQLRRSSTRLSLHHDHRDPDGTAHSPTGYGGHTQEPGTEQVQAFPVDEQTVAQLPAARGNVWSLEITPGQSLAYDLKRPADDRFFRVEFDLTAPAGAQ